MNSLKSCYPLTRHNFLLGPWSQLPVICQTCTFISQYSLTILSSNLQVGPRSQRYPNSRLLPELQLASATSLPLLNRSHYQPTIGTTVPILSKVRFLPKLQPASAISPQRLNRPRHQPNIGTVVPALSKKPGSCQGCN